MKLGVKVAVSHNTLVALHGHFIYYPYTLYNVWEANIDI